MAVTRPRVYTLRARRSLRFQRFDLRRAPYPGRFPGTNLIIVARRWRRRASDQVARMPNPAPAASGTKPGNEVVTLVQSVTVTGPSAASAAIAKAMAMR